ncbi:hypothetical protein SAMN05660860_01640 [Geoalkalibacter ferrihydriticus]|uniref:Type VI secretion system FHA domain-containing protein n=1 Tax=Geoalkalibacter ferrihydriticus TaxID=392333 RepID=A0A1G9PLV4_9BACT|nr:type VI secretion system-associated FHA domain protein [Geoalkalibacter ferrihydriticus]SDL99694.1 hypothetical protein SAMN05660860_01640 [Geoalkalibacter ferrihydriticus]
MVPKKKPVSRRAAAASTALPSQLPISQKRAAARIPAQALIVGLARMIEGLRCFADEFGLAQRRVLGSAWEEFQGRCAEDVLRAWLRDEDEGAQRIQRLFDDLMGHQMALLSGVEGVAREAAAHFNPRQVEQGTPRLLGMRPGAWRNYCRYYRELTANDHHLHRTLVLPGFVTAYVRAREARRESASIASPGLPPSSRS